MDDLFFRFSCLLARRLSATIHIPCFETTLYLMTLMTLHSVYCFVYMPCGTGYSIHSLVWCVGRQSCILTSMVDICSFLDS